MKFSCWFMVAGLLLAGCGKSSTTTYSDGKGNKVDVSSDGSKITAVDEKGNKTTVETGKDGGTVKVTDEKGTSTYEGGKELSEADLGVPFYPGSKEKAGGSFKAENPEEKAYVSSRTTSDEPAKVIAFYKDKVKDPEPSSMNNNGEELQLVKGKLENGAEVIISATRHKGESTTDVQVSMSLKTKK